MSLWVQNGSLVGDGGTLLECPACPCDDGPPFCEEFDAAWTDGPYDTAPPTGATAADDPNWTCDGSPARTMSDEANAASQINMIGNPISKDDDFYLDDESVHDFEMDFTVPGSIDETLLRLYVSVAYDNTVKIFVNGVDQGGSFPDDYGAHWHSHILIGPFNAGANTIKVELTQNIAGVDPTENPGGISVRFDCYDLEG